MANQIKAQVRKRLRLGRVVYPRRPGYHSLSKELKSLEPFVRTMAKVLLVALLPLLATVAQASVVLPDVIGDGMVLQRERAVPIWGTADPGEQITVRFAGQAKKAIADKGGKWLVRLDAMRASATPATMTIEGNNKVELKDILVGEVWLVAGQSNMQRLLSETANGAEAIAAANQPLIRLFNVSRQVAFKHASPPLATWHA